jgi:hypothetical protein
MNLSSGQSFSLYPLVSSNLAQAALNQETGRERGKDLRVEDATNGRHRSHGVGRCALIHVGAVRRAVAGILFLVGIAYDFSDALRVLGVVGRVEETELVDLGWRAIALGSTMALGEGRSEGRKCDAC